jgi:uncharacterized protein (DUF1800 family)
MKVRISSTEITMSSMMSVRSGRVSCWLSLALIVSLAVGGAVHAAATTMTLLLKNGGGAALASQKVHVYEVTAGGFVSRVGGEFTTDASGRVVLTGLDDSKTYFIKTTNSNGEWVQTGSIGGNTATASVTVASTAAVTSAVSSSGASTIVSSAPSAETSNNLLPPPADPVPPADSSSGGDGGGSGSTSAVIASYTVTVKDGITGALLNGVEVYAYQVKTTGGDALLPNMPLVTNGVGQIVFSNTNGTQLDDANTYYLRAKVFNNRWSNSETFRPTGALPSRNFLVGTLQVLVVDALVNPGNPVPQSNLKVTLQRRATGADPVTGWASVEILRTDANGLLKLNLQGLGFGFEYRLKSTYNSNVVISDIFSNPGSYIFPVAGSIATPALTARQKAHHVVNRLTFGMTPDLLDEINSAEANGFNGSQPGDPGIEAWIADFIADQLLFSDVAQAHADDTNLATYLANYSTIKAFPNLGYTGGYSSTANPWGRDGNSIVSVTTDPSYQTPTNPSWAVNTFYPQNYVIKNKTNNGDPDHQWYYSRKDQTSTVNDRPGDSAITSTWTSNWSSQNNTTATNYAGIIVPSTSQLQELYMRRLYRSQRQLLERMYWFWENHFNTDISADNKRHWEMAEAEMFRNNAMKRFYDLVELDGKSVAMLYYLNNNTNTKNAPNENYTREVFELHALGVDNGYTQADIVDGARCFTGWQQNSSRIHTWTPNFFFNSSNHDVNTSDPKVVLGTTIATQTGSAGVNEGINVIRVACRTQGCANFLSRKLVNYFISDTPSSTLKDDIATVFFNNRESTTQIKQVVTAIVNHSEFYNPTHFRNKFKTPLEIAISVARNFTDDPAYPGNTFGAGSFPPFGTLRTYTQNAGQLMFTYPFPTGWSELGNDWTGTNTALWTNQLAFDIARANSNRLGNQSDANVRTWMNSRGILSDPEAIIDYFAQLALGGELSGVERQKLRDCLNFGGTPFQNITSTSTQKQNLELMVGTLICLPGYLYQ